MCDTKKQQFFSVLLLFWFVSDIDSNQTHTKQCKCVCVCLIVDLCKTKHEQYEKQFACECWDEVISEMHFLYFLFRNLKLVCLLCWRRINRAVGKSKCFGDAICCCCFANKVFHLHFVAMIVSNCHWLIDHLNYFLNCWRLIEYIAIELVCICPVFFP